MPSTTTNYGLATYNSSTDQAESFLDYRTAVAGVSAASNMSLIDDAMNDNALAITALEAKKNIIAVPAAFDSPNTYLATVSGYTVYATNDVIDIVLDTDSNGTVQVNINSLGLKSLMKINSSGVAVNLDNTNLLADRHYLFTYDGTRWVWIGATSADQIDIGGTSGNLVSIASDGSIEDSTGKVSDFATLALDNLASTAVNTDLISDTDGTDSLGSTLKKWLFGFFDSISFGERASAPADVAGDYQVWSKSNTPNELWGTNDAGDDVRLDSVDGWIPVSTTWTYASATTITVPSGATSLYAVGDPFTLVANSVTLYGYIVNVATTLLTVVGDTLTSHAFSNVSFSKSNNPVGFPAKFSHTPVSTGFSADPTFSSQFSLSGRDVTWNLVSLADGTSDDTDITLTAPVEPKNYSVGYARGKDSGTNVAASYRASPSTLAVTFFKTLVSGWTNTGDKTINATVVYKI